MDSVLAFDQDTAVYINDDPNDDPKDKLLCGEIGRILTEHYPGWGWYVEIPARQNMVIIRNLTCDPRGTYGLCIHKTKLNMGLLRAEICKAAGAFLERYEAQRRHCGRFRPDDVDSVRAIFVKPEV